MTEHTSPVERGFRVAILDADTGFVRVLIKRMERLGWEPRVLRAPISREALVAGRPGALVLDPVVLGAGAWEDLAGLRPALPHLALVVCAGRASVAERVRGLRLGADAWITKPCHPEEVVAHLEAVVRRGRRAAAAATGGPLVAGELEIRADRYQAFVGGRSVDLTRREFELIELLVGARDRVLEREEVYARVWGYAMARGDRSVDVFVRKLRQKLEVASPGWRYIHTHFGVGYRFAAERVETPGDAPPAATDDAAGEAGVAGR